MLFDYLVVVPEDLLVSREFVYTPNGASPQNGQLGDDQFFSGKSFPRKRTQNPAVNKDGCCSGQKLEEY